MSAKIVRIEVDDSERGVKKKKEKKKKKKKKKRGELDFATSLPCIPTMNFLGRLHKELECQNAHTGSLYRIKKRRHRGEGRHVLNAQRGFALATMLHDVAYSKSWRVSIGFANNKPDRHRETPLFEVE